MRIILGILTLLLIGCQPLIEVNMVQRATISDGETINSSQEDSTVTEDEESMRLIVPLK